MHSCDGWTQVVDLTHHFQDIVISKNGECPENICVFGADDEEELFARTGEAVDEWLSGFQDRSVGVVTAASLSKSIFADLGVYTELCKI